MNEKINDTIAALRELSDNVSILYVESDIGLSKNMSALLNKISNNIFIAHDGEQGYLEYLKSKPKIVISGIKIPKMNGFKLIKKINSIDYESKIIILSTVDEKQHLYLAIKLGVFRYLHRPAKVPEIIDALYNAVLEIKKAEESRIFYNQLQNIFNYQNNIVLMMHKNKFILANQRFNEFFGIANLDEYFKKYSSVENLLLEHKEFLFTSTTKNWMDVAIENPGKLYHTKIQNSKNEYRHLILKLRNIPDKQEHYILSFDDITELHLMSLYDKDAAKNDSIIQDKKSIIALLGVVKENSSEVKIHNFYKGSSIVNPAVITQIDQNQFTIKTTNTQLKIIQFSKNMLITSEIFPKAVMCKSLKNIDFDNQTIIADEMHFAQNSEIDRKYIRLQPDFDHRCTIFYKDVKLSNDTNIVDLSEISVKVKIDTLPAGMTIEAIIKISINLKLKGRLISFTTHATIYKIEENGYDYNLILLFKLDGQNLNNIREYLANRQIELIREFRSIDINPSIHNKFVNNYAI